MAERNSWALKRAVALVGGLTALARGLGISPQAISQWRQVPAARVLAVERETGGAVTRSELRPDLYPPGETPQRQNAKD